MSTQLTLQAPLDVPPAEVHPYLDQLWNHGLEGSTGAATFTLLIWEPSWLEQQMVRIGRIDGPIRGLERNDLIEAARLITAECDLPFSTAPMDPRLAWNVGQLAGHHEAQDLRGQFIPNAISVHTPRRLITLVPTLDASLSLETMVAAYCPLPDEGGAGAACGDAIVLRGGMDALRQGLPLIQPLIDEALPCWVWWNSSLDEPPEMLESLATLPRRLVIDTSLGQPARCLDVLVERIEAGQAVNDLNWLRLRSWRESLAMVFDPPSRRDALAQVVQLDIDVEGDHPVKGLLPKAHPGAIVGLRLICEPANRPALCVILCSESGGCMRLESGGMAAMELVEEVVPLPEENEEMEMARLLGGGHDTTNPLLAAAAPLAATILPR